MLKTKYQRVLASFLELENFPLKERSRISIMLLYHLALYNTSARPEVRGTADVGWQSLFPLPLNPPRTHSRLYHHMCLRTDGQ